MTGTGDIGRGQVVAAAVAGATVAGSAVLLLLAAGALLTVHSLVSVTAVPRLVFAAALLWPVYAVYRNELWRSDRLAAWAAGNRERIAVTAVLAVLSAAAFRYGGGIPARILTLPLESGSGAVYAAAVEYRGVAGRTGTGALFETGRWTLQLVWLYLVAGVGADLTSTLRDRFD